LIYRLIWVTFKLLITMLNNVLGKILLYSLIVCLKFGFLQAQTTNPNGYNKFYYENGKISSEGLMKDGKPNGYWKNYYKNGKLKIEGNRKNFQLDSVWKFYDEKGRLSKTINYAEGKKNGITAVYDTLGKIVSSENYAMDVKDGLTRTFYKTGKTKSTVPFVKGKQEGTAYEYSQDSVITAISTYKGGILQGYEKINQRDENNKKQGIWKEFYENRELKKEQKFNDDSLDGYVKEFDKKGNLISTKKFSNGQQILRAPEIANVEVYREVFEDGTLKYEGVYSDGDAIGTHYKYVQKRRCDSSLFRRDDTTDIFINRMVCRNVPIPDSAIEYFDGTVVAKGAVDSLRNRIGLWTEYHNTGEFKGKGLYKEGNRIGDWEFFYASGKLEQKGKYDKKGRAQGVWKWYYESGKLWREENYVNGKRDGELKDYDEEGKVMLQGNFVENRKEGRWTYETPDYLEFGTYTNDEPDSLWKSYYMPGKVKHFEGRFLAGEPVGLHEGYHPTGARMYVGNYVSGMKDGDWKYYDENGFNYLVITYKNDIEIKWQGEKIRPTYEESLKTYNIKIDENRTQTIRK
jgi:antitoxin component YwqK of YwqJK toxin-antitoxin module